MVVAVPLTRETAEMMRATQRRAPAPPLPPPGQLIPNAPPPPSTSISTPHPHDVLCGRNRGNQGHAGNVRYRKYVKDLGGEYQGTRKVAKKTLIAARVVQQIRALHPPGRFLKESGGLWEVISDGEVDKKVKMALAAAASPQNSSPGRPASVASAITIHAHDVLGGQGQAQSKHPGNLRYIKIVDAFTREFQKVPCGRKNSGRDGAVARTVQQIRALDPPGRFLKKDPDTGLWVEISDKDVTRKVKQALRDAVLRKLPQPAAQPEAQPALQEGGSTLPAPCPEVGPEWTVVPARNDPRFPGADKLYFAPVGNRVFGSLAAAQEYEAKLCRERDAHPQKSPIGPSPDVDRPFDFAPLSAGGLALLQHRGEMRTAIVHDIGLFCGEPALSVQLYAAGNGANLELETTLLWVPAYAITEAIIGTGPWENLPAWERVHYDPVASRPPFEARQSEKDEAAGLPGSFASSPVAANLDAMWTEGDASRKPPAKRKNEATGEHVRRVQARDDSYTRNSRLQAASLLKDTPENCETARLHGLPDGWLAEVRHGNLLVKGPDGQRDTWPKAAAAITPPPASSGPGMGAPPPSSSGLSVDDNDWGGGGGGGEVEFEPVEPAPAAGAEVQNEPAPAAGAEVQNEPAPAAGAEVLNEPVPAAGAGVRNEPAPAAGAGVRNEPAPAAGAGVADEPAPAAAGANNGVADEPAPAVANGANAQDEAALAAGLQNVADPAAGAGNENEAAHAAGARLPSTITLIGYSGEEEPVKIGQRAGYQHFFIGESDLAVLSQETGIVYYDTTVPFRQLRHPSVDDYEGSCRRRQKRNAEEAQVRDHADLTESFATCAIL